MTASLIFTLLAILAGLSAGELLCGVLFKDQSNNPADENQKGGEA